MRHIDDSRTRVYEIDSICVYADFDLMQDVLSMGRLERVERLDDAGRGASQTARAVEKMAWSCARRAKAVEGVWEEFLGVARRSRDPHGRRFCCKW